MKHFNRFIVLFLAIASLWACKKEIPDNNYLTIEQDYYSVTKKGVTFNGEKIVIPVKSNTYWTAVLPEDCDWVTLDPKGATGDADVVATVAENMGEERSCEIHFTSLKTPDAVVIISQSSAGETIYYMKDTFEDAPVGEITSETESWKVGGIGVENGTWTATGAIVSNDEPSDTYEDASAGKNILLPDGASMVYGPIAVSDRSYIISLGALSTTAVKAGEPGLVLSISKTTQYWAPVATLTDVTTTWRYYRKPFMTEDGKDSFYIKVEAIGGSYRIDDISLDEGDESGEIIVFPEDNIKYVYYPAYSEDFEWLHPNDNGNTDMPGSDGGNINDEPDMHGLTASAVYRRPGFIKMGATNSQGVLTTPKVEALGSDAKDVWIDFDAAGYSSDDDEITLVLVGGALFAETNETSYNLIIASYNKWKHFQIEAKNANANTQLTIKGSKSAEELKASGRQNRFFIDNIAISYREEVGVETRPTISASPELIELPVNGAAQTVKITSNYGWTATPSADWIALEPASGVAGTSTISISASEATADREGTVTFTTNSGKNDVDVTITVKQSYVKPALVMPEVRTIYKTWNTVAFTWDRMTSSYNTENNYTFELYDVAGNRVGASQKWGFKDTKYRPSVTYSALTENTKYTFKVYANSDKTEECDNSPVTEVEFTTSSKPVETTEYILVERFDGLVWGGDFAHNSFGWRVASEGAITENNPNDAKTFTTPGTATADLFATFKAEYKDAVLNNSGWTGSKGYMFVGALKLGTTTALGYVQTPALSKIEGTKDIKLRFKASLWQDFGSGTSPDAANTIVITVPEGSGTPEQKELTITKALNADQTALEWDDLEVIIRGAKADTKINIAAKQASKNRFFLDDIEITEIGETEIPTEKVAAPTDVQILVNHKTDLAFKWTECSDNTARKYRVHLYTSPTAAPVRSYDVTFENKYHQASFTFAKLDYNTTYYLGVQSVSGVADKDDSEVVMISGKTLSATTLGENVVFFEGFDKCCWGGDHVFYTYGAKPADTGKNAGSDDAMSNVCNSNAGGSANVFGTMNDKWLEDRGLSAWPKGTAVYEFPGYIKFGAASSAGTVATPAFTALGEEIKDLVFTCNVAPWVEPTTDPNSNTSDNADIKITVEGAGTIYYNGEAVTGELVINVGAYTQRTWTELSFEIHDATKDTKVKFNSIHHTNNNAKNCRWCLDEIMVTKK